MRTLLTIIVIGGLLVVGLSGGCARPTRPAGGSTGSRAEHARQNAESLAMNVVTGVANSQSRFISTTTGEFVPPPSGAAMVVSPQGVSSTAMKQPPQPPRITNASRETPQMSAHRDPLAQRSASRPASPTMVREHVKSSMPYTSELEADDDALAVAQGVIEQRLAALDPPVYYRPTLNEVKQEFVRKESRTVSEPNSAVTKEFIDHKLIEPGKRLVYVEYDLDLTAEQIRELHTRERAAMLFKGLLGFTCIALAGFLFLRADEWTKGYLTHWLACGAVVLAGGAVAALYFI